LTILSQPPSKRRKSFEFSPNTLNLTQI
jgi:hypothetical protein